MIIEIAKMLVKQDVITIDQMRTAIDEQKRTGKGLGEVLVSLEYLDEHRLMEFLSREYDTPAVNLESLQIESSVLGIVPHKTALNHNVIPLSRSGATLVVAMADPSNILKLDDLRFATGYIIKPVLASERAIKDAIEKYYGVAVEGGAKKPKHVTLKKEQGWKRAEAIIKELEEFKKETGEIKDAVLQGKQLGTETREPSQLNTTNVFSVPQEPSLHRDADARQEKEEQEFKPSSIFTRLYESSAESESEADSTTEMESVPSPFISSEQSEIEFKPSSIFTDAGSTAQMEEAVSDEPGDREFDLSSDFSQEEQPWGAWKGADSAEPKAEYFKPYSLSSETSGQEKKSDPVRLGKEAVETETGDLSPLIFIETETATISEPKEQVDFRISGNVTDFFKPLLEEKEAAVRESEAGEKTIPSSVTPHEMTLEQKEKPKYEFVESRVEEPAESDDPNPQPVSELLHESAPSLRESVLVVDDSPTIQKIVSITLERKGYQVLVASNAMQALAKLNDSVPNLIFLDINLPHMDGYKLCKIIKGNDLTRDVPVVMLSGKDGFFDKVRGRIAGATDYITKPFDAMALVQAVEKYGKRSH